MGKALIEKIMSSHGGEDCRAGDVVWIDIDNRTARDFAGASVVGNLEKYGGDSPIAERSKTFFTFDCNVPANTIPYANNQQRIRIFARKNDLKVYDVDAGIGSHVVIEEKFAKPGTTTVGTDSHLNIMGSVGAFGQGMGDVDIAYAFKTGKVWFEVPESVKVTLDGMPAAGTEAKDIALAMLRRFSSHELLGKSVEIYGKWVEDASLEDCVTLSSLATEMGAIIALIPPNDNVLDFFGITRNEAVYADPDTVYLEDYSLDIEGLEPQIAAPPSPANVFPVSEKTDVKVDGVFIGSCTNGTYQDLRYAAELLRGRTVAPGVMLKVVPATRKTWAMLLDEGLLKDIFDAGGIVSNAGCGGCASGQIGMTGEGEVQISTSNRNFKGKQGRGNTYLAGIGTAVASAVLGRIASVHELKEVR
ncbi:MAG: 3-isopropylmalate dehydratase large subunit [Candidatus Aegiribacteria sp.]|nr:3-isopropylmalate dehydratase large subunit [Candidatus Aegiribacteria sp.]